MSQDTRKDFSQYQIDIVYNLQDGSCPKCGAGLEQTGMNRHHKDKDHTNNSISNLELLCPRCHHALSGLSNPYTRHKQQEELVLSKINDIVQQILSPQTVEVVDGKGNKTTKVLELSGVILDKLVDSLTLSLKVSRNVTDVDYGREFTPNAIKIQRKMMEAEVSGESYMSGYMEGVKATVSKLGVKTD